MARLDLKGSKITRKRQLAELVVERLRALGHEAELVTGRVNSAGHRDTVVVQSSLGLVHTTASVNTDPNGSILVCDIEDAGQQFLEDKALVAYGWVDRSGRTQVRFVRPDKIKGRKSLTKAEIIGMEEPGLGLVLLP